MHHILRKHIYLLITVGFLSCGEPPKKEITNTYSRQLIVYDFDTIVENVEYKLIRKERDSVIHYEYLSLVDSTKRMNLQYIKHTGRIHFGPTEFELKEHNRIQADFEFDRYETEPFPDSMDSMIFNEEYGILAFGNGQGMQFHFLTDKNLEQFDLPMIYKVEDLEE